MESRPSISLEFRLAMLSGRDLVCVLLSNFFVYIVFVLHGRRLWGLEGSIEGGILIFVRLLRWEAKREYPKDLDALESILLFELLIHM